jgi:iron uptake system EfeUOB component EfeO/EfeM
MQNEMRDRLVVNNVEHHMEIVTEMNKLYERKNKDYGDSFHKSFLEEGMAMARIRLGDKLNRFKTLTKSDHQEVKDESIRDTLIDLANYAIMTIMEIDRKE